MRTQNTKNATGGEVAPSASISGVLTELTDAREHSLTEGTP